jgi:hypothetical protein
MASPENDQQVEYEIQNKGLNAPRLSPAHIDSVIKDIRYHRVEGTTTTICSLILTNDFVVNGESASASIENFDADMGKKIAFNNARDKIWMLEGYLLRQKLYERNQIESK